MFKEIWKGISNNPSAILQFHGKEIGSFLVPTSNSPQLGMKPQYDPLLFHNTPEMLKCLSA